MWDFIGQFWDQGVDVATLILAIIGTLSTLGLLRRRSKTLKDLIYIEQERDTYRNKLTGAEVRLGDVDPERFIDKANELYEAGKFDAAETAALDFTNCQSEAFGRAAEILTEQRIIDSETDGQAALDEAARFVQIGLAADPASARLRDLQELTRSRSEGLSRGEPIEALNWGTLSAIDLYTLSVALERDGKYWLAEIAARRMVPLARLEHGAASVSYGNALGRHGSTLKALNQFQAAETLYRAALKIIEPAAGMNSVDYATQLSNLAGVLGTRGAPAEAEQMFRKALDIDRATVGPTHADYATTLNNLGLVVRAQGRYDEAEEIYSEVIKIDRATIGEAHPTHAAHLNNMARVLHAQSDYDTAEKIYADVLRIDRETIGDMHPDYAFHLGNLVALMQDQGRTAEALPLAEQALEIFRQTLPEGDSRITMAEDNLMDLRAKVG